MVSELILPAVIPGGAQATRSPARSFRACCWLAQRPCGGHGSLPVRVLAILCLVALPVWWLAKADPFGTLAVWRPVVTALVLVLLALVVLSTVLRAGTLTRHQIQGGIAAYLLLGPGVGRGL